MTQRSLPPVGGGGPIVHASGVARRTSTRDATMAPLTLTLTVNEEAARTGLAVLELIREACSEPPTEAAIDAVADLEFFFHVVTRRVPEFHAFMDELVRDGREEEVRRIVQEPGRRGRRREFPTAISLIELVLDENPTFTAARAIEWLDENLRNETREDGSRMYLQSPGRMRNVYSKFKELYALWSQSLFVPGEMLTDSPWCTPEEQQRTRARLRELLGGDPAPIPFERVAPHFFTQEGFVPIVGASDPEFGPYSGLFYALPPTPGQRLAERWRFLTPGELARAADYSNQETTDGEGQQGSEGQ